MIRIILLICAFAGVVYVRSTVVENIKPWEAAWFLWVLSTSLVSFCLGWVCYEVMHNHKHHKGEKNDDPAKSPTTFNTT